LSYIYYVCLETEADMVISYDTAPDECTEVYRAWNV